MRRALLHALIQSSGSYFDAAGQSGWFFIARVIFRRAELRWKNGEIMMSNGGQVREECRGVFVGRGQR